MVVVDGTLPMKDLLRIGFRELFEFIEPFTVLWFSPATEELLR